MTELLARLPPDALAAILSNVLTLTAAWLALWTALVVGALCLLPRGRRSRSTLI